MEPNSRVVGSDGSKLHYPPMSLIDEARGQLGELLMIGFSGMELSDETAAFFSQAGVGGAILFGHNYESPGQVAELTNQIQECRTDLPLWVGVDHEGGRVQRFKKPFTRIPDAEQISATASPKLAFDLAEMMGKELKAVGVNVNFCPVADIMTNPKNPVIGPRSYGSSEEQVSKMVTAMVRGHLVAGVQPVVKHFPGHGDTSVDSHFALPKIDTPLETLRERELKPFVRAFKSRCSMVMTAHIVNPKLDPERPATLSPKVLQDILRRELRYSKVVFSDDMEMKAIADHFGAADAPWMAVEAGCDILIYRSEAAGRKAFEALNQALDAGKLKPETVLQAAARSRTLKKETLVPYEAVAVQDVSRKVGIPEHQALVDKIIGPQVAGSKP